MLPRPLRETIRGGNAGGTAERWNVELKAFPATEPRVKNKQLGLYPANGARGVVAMSVSKLEKDLFIDDASRWQEAVHFSVEPLSIHSSLTPELSRAAKRLRLERIVRWRLLPFGRCRSAA